MTENIDPKQLHDFALDVAERLARGLENVLAKSFSSESLMQTLEKLKKRSMGVNFTESAPESGTDQKKLQEFDQKICSEPDCNLPARARGLCSKHYQRLRYAEKRASELGEPPPKTLSEAKANRLNKPVRKTSKRGGGTCSKEGCDRPNYAKGLCGKHFMEWVRSKKNEEGES